MIPTWLLTTQSLLALAPTILQLIIAIEGMFPKKASGDAKKALVMAAVTDAHPELIAAASKFVDASVKHLNDAGVFPIPPAV